MSKGIAIQTILYLLIGVLVVGIVVYLVYSYVMNPVLPETQCRILATSWCTSCKGADWVGGPEATGDLISCVGRHWSGSEPANWGPGCVAANNCCTGAETFCSSIAGIT